MTPDPAVTRGAELPGIHQITTLDPQDPGDDLDSLITFLQGAAVVSIGEPTHGTAECHLLRQRIIQELVIHAGCRAIGLEAGWAETLPLARYLRDGDGDAASAVAALGFWMWDVWEFRALVDWLRAFNAGRAAADRVRIFGFDCPKGAGATDLLSTLLAHDPALLRPEVEALLADCRSMVPWEAPADEPSAESVTSGLEKLAEDLRASLVLDDGSRSLALTAIRLLQIVDERRRADDNLANWNLRDREMASTVLREIDVQGAAGPVVVLAHNAHVGKDARGLFWPDMHSMGMHLADHLGPGYVSIGQLFGEGAFQAMIDDGTGTYRLGEAVVGPPPKGSLDWHLWRLTEPPASWMETGDLPLAPDAEGMLLIREGEASFTTEAETHVTRDIAAQHDVVLFIATTTRSHPTPTGYRELPV
jgi:erythromycin esterase